MTTRNLRRLRAFSVLVVLITLAGTTAKAQGNARSIEAEDVNGREDWFWFQRSFPFKERPYDQMSSLRATLQARMSRMASLAATSALGGAWRPLGPEGLWVFEIESGRIAAILPAVAPGGPMYAGTASGGVWRSTNNGITWTPLTDNECSLTTGAMARDPSLPSIVYAATGEGNQGTGGCGVLRSSNDGNSWITGQGGLRSSNGGFGPFSSLVVDPASAGGGATILLGTTNFTNAGVVRSTNSGLTWTPALNTGPASSLVAHPTRPGTYYVGNRVTATVASRGVWKSTDVGATWTQLPALPVDPNAMSRIEIAVSHAAPNSIWALVGDRSSGGFLGLFRYDEATSAWTQLAASGITSAFGTQQSYDLVLAIDPRDEKKMFVAGVRAFRSTDGGATFKPIANEVHTDWHVITFDPNNPDIMWAGTDGGVYISTDAGNTWTSRSAGLSITQFYPGVSVHPLGTRVAGGSQDNGTHVYSGTPFWDAFSGGDGGYTAINFKDPSIQWGETQWSVTSGTVGNIFRRDGIGLTRRATGIGTTDRASFIPPLVMDPVNPSKLYFGTYRLYRTTNEGQLWTAISGDLTNGTGVISSVAISPTDTNTIWVGTSDGRALVSSDGGTTFAAATGLPARSVTRVVPHPTDSRRALVTVSGFGAAHVWETADAFVSPVVSISAGLIDAPTNVALYVPSANVIMVGTDVGIFQTGDGGSTWVAGPTGMPNVIIQDLVFRPEIGLIVAGTYGRGMFAYNVGASQAVLRGDVNGDGKIDAFDALLIQQTLISSVSSSTVVYPRGDANCNGRIDAGDLVLVLRAAVGLSNSTGCVGTTR